jgi:GYF domain 2
MLLKNYPHKIGFENILVRQYYIYDGQRERGPFNLEQLKSQSLGKQTPIWYEGLENWASAENVDELQKLFIRKVTPPPLPKLFEKNPVSRDEVLNSFTEAPEIVPGPNKKSLVKPIVIFVIIMGILILL